MIFIYGTCSCFLVLFSIILIAVLLCNLAPQIDISMPYLNANIPFNEQIVIELKIITTDINFRMNFWRQIEEKNTLLSFVMYCVFHLFGL